MTKRHACCVAQRLLCSGVHLIPWLARVHLHAINGLNLWPTLGPTLSQNVPPGLPNLQAQTGETVVLGVNEVSSALRRQYGNDKVPEHLGDVLR